MKKQNFYEKPEIEEINLVLEGSFLATKSPNDPDNPGGPTDPEKPDPSEPDPWG